MNIKELSDEGESSYCNCPSSGRGTKSTDIILKDIIPNIKQISLRKPFAMIVGSMATQGKSNNDIDIVVRGEDLSDKIKESIDFRIYRHFTDILKCPYDDITKYVHIHYNNAGSYTSYVPLYELNLVPMDKFETIQMSKIPFALRGNLNIVNKSDGPRIIAGYANVAVVDSEEQFIPIETLKKGIICLLQDPHYSNLMLVHQNIQIGKIIEKFGEHTTHVDEKGLFIVCEIRKDLQSANEVWDAILKNEINGFSIGCEVLNSHKKCDENKCITILDEINIFEVSVCTEPVNQKSGFIVISKSQFEKFHGDIDMLNVDNKSERNMVEEIKKAETPCTNCTEPIVELSIEERLESLEKKMLDFLEMAKKKEEEKKKPAEETCKEKAVEASPVVQEVKAPEAPPVPPVPPVAPEGKPQEEDMAIFMLDYIIKNPKSSAQDIAKAWIKSKQPPKEKPPEQPVQEPPVNPEEQPPQWSMDSLMKQNEVIIEKLSKLDHSEELKVSLKSRDDAISALEKKVEVLTKSKEPEKKVEPEIKTVQVPQEPKLEVEGLVSIRNGEVTSSEFM